MTRARVPKEHYAPRLTQLLDWATGDPICYECHADLGEGSRKVFCSHKCRSIHHGRERRARAAARTPA